jgi:hypothetical protein
MTSADKRVEELLDRWMASLELHAGYLKLDDAAYARAEKWPKHQRPTRWVVELARKRLLELRAQLGPRRDAGDAAFAEALELMSFLTGLLGTEHIERFIPLATGKPPDTGVSGTVVQPKVRAVRPRASSGQSGVHRQPARSPTVAKEAVVAKAAAASKKTPSPPPIDRGPPRPVRVVQEAPVAATPQASAPHDARTAQVIADAARMLDWGREWPALAGLIARMADRPTENEIWKILRAHRAEILAKARRAKV